MSVGGWKKHLLRSGLPFEYEVAQLLAKDGMAVEADYSFSRLDSGVEKECSVDIKADWYSDDNATLELNMLIECKCRSPNKTLLFFLDPNIEFSPITTGVTVNYLDSHLPYNFDSNNFSKPEEEYEYVYKAVEIYDDGAVEQEFRHGIQQLRYATPDYLKNTIDFQFFGHLVDSHPIFYTRILVTNAPIRIVKHNCSLNDLESANTIEDISDTAEVVILYSDYGSDYTEHFKRIFAQDADWRVEAARIRGNEVGKLEKRYGQSESPFYLVTDLEQAARYRLMLNSTQFFVCTLQGLAGLIERIKQACLMTFEEKKSQSAHT